VTPPSDSIGQVSIELARILEPLRVELQPGRAKSFFAQIGITVTDAQAMSEINTAVGHTQDLIALVRHHRRAGS
jgi:hypothetical protein